MLQRDPLRSPLTDGPASGRPHGLHLPLLPTLATAVLAAAVSLLCQEPDVAPASLSAPALAEPARTAEIAIEPTSFARGFGADAETAAIRPAAVLAFAQFYPVLPEAAETRVAARSAPRLAVLPPRRPCPGPRCGDGAIPRRANPFAAVRPAQDGHGEAVPVAFGQGTGQGTAGGIGEGDVAEDGPSFPRLALPFAPAARIVGAAAGMVRGGASALGSSVSLFVDRLR